MAGDTDRASSRQRPKRPEPRALSLPECITPMVPPNGFTERCAALGVEFEAQDLPQLGMFLSLLLEMNTVMNLTAITEPAAAWEKHIFDSLTLLPLLASTDSKRVIDVGSGGGVPGVPLAIVLPGVQFTLVEATAKKARFLELAAMRLQLANVTVVAERAETVGQNRHAHRERYDAAIARALGHLAVVLELCVPLVRLGGLVLAVKGEKAAEEITQSAEALRMLHVNVARTVPTPTGQVVVIEKSRPTPKIYPRRAGEPKRAPLGGHAQ